MKTNNIIAIAVIMLISVTAHENFKVKENPVPENVKKLYVFLGNWKGKATMTADGKNKALIILWT